MTKALREAAQMALDALAGAIKTNQFDMLMTGQECRDGEASIEALRAALALPDEPVAYVIMAGNGNIRIWTTLQPHIQALADSLGVPLVKWYATPQAAPLERQLLTDAAISHCINQVAGDSVPIRTLARCVERQCALAWGVVIKGAA